MARADGSSELSPIYGWTTLQVKLPMPPIVPVIQTQADDALSVGHCRDDLPLDAALVEEDDVRAGRPRVHGG